MTKGKVIGRIFTVITALICLCALMFSIYMGGQEKTAESYYTAVIRDDFSEFSSLFTDGVYNEELPERLKSDYVKLSEGFKLDETSLMHIRINFKRREFLSLTENRYFYTVTYYDDDVNSLTTDESDFHLKFEDFVWKIAS